MGLFKKPLTPEELEQKERYEASKVRLMELHKTAKVIFYIDEVTKDLVHHRPVLIGEIGKGQLKNGDTLEVYSNEGLPVGTMEVDIWEEREERHFIPGRTLRTFCFPKEEWDGYIAGQMLVKTERSHNGTDK
ncbi:MAG: hypothetical protein IJ040_00065 [Lachnospiraceae bacterium]|nr:hypothetical protein [Lachnospiraceae bacterium]